MPVDCPSFPETQSRDLISSHTHQTHHAGKQRSPRQFRQFPLTDYPCRGDRPRYCFGCAGGVGGGGGTGEPGGRPSLPDTLGLSAGTFTTVVVVAACADGRVAPTNPTAVSKESSRPITLVIIYPPKGCAVVWTR